MRTTTTTEQLGFKAVFAPSGLSPTIGRAILEGTTPTKWMTPEAAAGYRSALTKSKVQRVKDLLAADPDTRQAVLHGPIGACWVATQVISDPATPGAYQVVAFYRSMDSEHLISDAHLQTAIAMKLIDRVSKLTIFITSFHSY